MDLEKDPTGPPSVGSMSAEKELVMKEIMAERGGISKKRSEIVCTSKKIEERRSIQRDHERTQIYLKNSLLKNLEQETFEKLKADVASGLEVISHPTHFSDYSSDMDNPSADETDDSAENCDSRRSHSRSTLDENLEIISSSDCALKSEKNIKNSWKVLAVTKSDTHSKGKQRLPSSSDSSTTKFGAV